MLEESALHTVDTCDMMRAAENHTKLLVISPEQTATVLALTWSSSLGVSHGLLRFPEAVKTAKAFLLAGFASMVDQVTLLLMLPSTDGR